MDRSCVHHTGDVMVLEDTVVGKVAAYLCVKDR